MIQGVPESENQKEAAENSAPKEEDIPQSGDTGALSKMLSHLPARWRNWWIRVSTSFLMLFGFIFIGYLGPLAIVLLILAIQLKAFHEVCSSNRISWRLKSVHKKKQAYGQVLPDRLFSGPYFRQESRTELKDRKQSLGQVFRQNRENL